VQDKVLLKPHEHLRKVHLGEPRLRFLPKHSSFRTDFVSGGLVPNALVVPVILKESVHLSNDIVAFVSSVQILRVVDGVYLREESDRVDGAANDFSEVVEKKRPA